VLAELALSILAFLCTLFVMGLQFAQYSRWNVDVGRPKVCPFLCLTFVTKNSFLLPYNSMWIMHKHPPQNRVTRRV
jgi:hypothetical protein